MTMRSPETLRGARRTLRGARRLRRALRRARGTATIEFAVCLPFLISLVAIVWDVRQHLLDRTKVVRQMDTIAQAVATELTNNPLQGTVDAVVNMFQSWTASGSVQIAVVVRGTERRGTPPVPCPANQWCPPRVLRVVPGAAGVQTAPRTWQSAGGNGCTDPSDPDNRTFLPALGNHFGATDLVMICEVGGAACGRSGVTLTEPNWVSRNMNAQQWWVVLDVCVEPVRGMFAGRFTNWTVDLFDGQSEERRRVVWPSLYELVDCDWCT